MTVTLCLVLLMLGSTPSGLSEGPLGRVWPSLTTSGLYCLELYWQLHLIFRALLCILDMSSAVFWIVSILPLISSSPGLVSKLLRTVPRAQLQLSPSLSTVFSVLWQGPRFLPYSQLRSAGIIKSTGGLKGLFFY